MNVQDNEERELTFAELFEETIKSVEEGQIVKGKIINVTNKEIYVDLGYKADGIIPFSEYSDNPSEDPEVLCKAGEEIEALVLKINDGDGNVLLSKKRIEYGVGLEMLDAAYKEGSILTGVITEVVNGGVIVPIKSVRVFIPASQLGLSFISNLYEYKTKEIKFKVIEFNVKKKKFVGSQRIILEQERQVIREKLMNELEVGKIIPVVIKKIMDFGAFVDVGGVDGLIHISELSEEKIHHPSDIVKEGQTIDARVIKMDKESGKISLSLKEEVAESDEIVNPSK